MEGLLALAEKSSSAAGGRSLMKRIGNVLIECLQNVMRHGLIEENGFTQLYLTLESTPVGFQVQCGNMVDTEMRSLLSNRLSEINGMEEEVLRKTYIETLCNGELSNKGGAGRRLLHSSASASGCGGGGGGGSDGDGSGGGRGSGSLRDVGGCASGGGEDLESLRLVLAQPRDRLATLAVRRQLLLI